MTFEWKSDLGGRNKKVQMLEKKMAEDAKKIAVKDAENCVILGTQKRPHQMTSSSAAGVASAVKSQMSSLNTAATTVSRLRSEQSPRRGTYSAAFDSILRRRTSVDLGLDDSGSVAESGGLEEDMMIVDDL